MYEETEQRISHDRFDRPEALIIPCDVYNRYKSRGYVLIRPTQCGGNERVSIPNYRTMFEKIDLVKILDIDTKFFNYTFSALNIRMREGWVDDDKHTFASAKYGFVLVEEFDENYVIEVRDVDIETKINLSRDMVKEFQNLGFESKIVGDNIFVYVRKKMKM